jgi:hypothetical protein
MPDERKISGTADELRRRFEGAWDAENPGFGDLHPNCQDCSETLKRIFERMAADG